ncbi:Hsp33 family molecular chaperone HslO [Dokdonella koreensis]|uniref:Disulfide bond chaperone n=1 Tax=Dokdonella koreensis DS-123 TaxID=1300342 RepID=A0A160DVW4_9GAMM|nr:Hsp33 family molecular chaperone HslO [Dokdonella koreensis]ANB18301.1 Disulfide bond chaperone [Dokdonella koreensis DS-123]
MATHDFLQRFLLEQAGVHGAFVRLDKTWRDVRSHTDYPKPLASLLGRTLAASALLTGTIKFRGRLSIQFRSEGALRLLFAECTDSGGLRGLARWDEEAEGTAELGEGAILAVTIEQPDRDLRQQALVACEGNDLTGAFERYFEQSEQLPTRMLLVEHGGRCAGLLLQPIADGGGISLGDPDAWNRVGYLMATAMTDELVNLSAEELLTRLFHEEGVRVFAPRPLAFACSCSRSRVETMLRSLGRDECEAAIAADGQVGVTCEFCNRNYRLDRVDIAGLFASTPPMAGPVTAQ